MSVWHVEACRHTQMKIIAPIKPSDSEPYYTMSVWHVEACRHTQMRCIPPNWSQCCRALLHHVHLTCGSMQTYPNEMYLHSWNPVLQSPTTPSLLNMWKHADTPKWKLLPQSNPVIQSPTTQCQFDMWKHADIPKWDVSPQIDPSASEPYYTMSIWHVEACRHTQMRCIPP